MTPLVRLAPLFLAASILLSLRAAGEPADEVAAAFSKLRESSYRKRESVELGTSMPRGVNLPPMVTECTDGVERIVYEIDAPGVGKIQTMQIRSGSRSAVKIVAPGLLAKIESMRHHLTVSAAKSLLNQIISVATAVQTGGLSTAGWVQEAIRAAATITTTAQARVALDAALKQFNSWQLVPVEDGETEEATGPAMESDDAAMYGSVEKAPGGQAGTIRYTRRPSMSVPGADLTNVVVVNDVTGLPVSEENYLNGKRIMRTDYFDVGAPLAIELPECLR